MNPASTPEPPNYAVIFPSRQTGIESAHKDDGLGAMVSNCKSLVAIKGWKANEEHLAAQQKGHALRHDPFELRIAKVKRACGMNRNSN